MILSVLIRKTSFESLFWNIVNKNSKLSDFLRETAGTNKTRNYLILRTDGYDLVQKKINSCLQGLISEENISDPYSNGNQVAVLTSLFTELLRLDESSASLKKIPDEKKFNAGLFRQYLNENHSTCTLSNIAAFFHYSKTHMSRVIRETCGKTYTQIIREVRLSKSVRV